MAKAHLTIKAIYYSHARLFLQQKQQNFLHKDIQPEYRNETKQFKLVLDLYMQSFFVSLVSKVKLFTYQILIIYLCFKLLSNIIQPHYPNMRVS